MAFSSSSSSSDNKSDSKRLSPSCPSDRVQPSGGYNAVPPPITGNFMPPKPDLVFHTVPIAVETDHSAFTVQLTLQIASSFVQSTEQVKPPRHLVQPVETSIPATPKPTSLNPSPKTNTSPPKVTAVKAPVVSAAQGIKGKWGNLQQDLKDKGVIDSGCSRHMTGNRSYLTYYEEIDGGFVTFGGNFKGWKITRKGTLRTGKLDFKDVYFVKELKFDLFSVSQICGKKNSVLFTDTACVVLSPDFKLTDESHILLKVPKKDNMYSVDLKDVVPQGGLTCLFAKAISDESTLWHKRLRHTHGRMILESVENGPLLWPTVKENGVTRSKKYSELSTTEAIQADCDVKATNIILQGLPPQVYALVSTHKVKKELWERIQMLMQGTSLMKQERELFQKGDDPIDSINHMMSLLTAVVTSRYPLSNNQLRTSSNPRQQATINNGKVTIQPIQGRRNSITAGMSRQYTSGPSGTSGKLRVIVCYNCKDEGHMSKQCTKPKRKRDEVWFKEKVLLVQAQANGQVLHEEELEFLADPGIAETQSTYVIQNTNAILIHDSEETLMLEDESRSKMLHKQKDPMMSEKKNELSTKQAFWSQYSVNSKEPNLSSSTTIVEVPKELPKVSMVLVITALKNTISKLKGKAVVNEAVTLHPIDPELLKIDVAPLAPKLSNNRTAHNDYLKHTQEETATLREIVKNKRLLDPVNTSLDYALARDEAFVPHAKRLRIGRSNFCLLSDIKSKESTLQLVYEVLHLTPFFKAFLVTADVLEIYMQEFWVTATIHHHSIRFKMDNKKHIVNLESFREMLHICPRLPHQPFVEPPFEEEILAFLWFLGHSGAIRRLTNVNINKLHQPWRSFAAIINKYLTGKNSSYDSLRLSQAQIL
nr:ribonuclease H-like domain-containing protein [Tanacetum cinerariifolium]